MADDSVHVDQDPYASQLPGNGASLIVWLILGGMVALIVIAFWEERRRNEILAHTSVVEEEVRQTLRESYRFLKENRLEGVFANDKILREKFEWLLGVRPNGYVVLRVSSMLIRSDAEVSMGDQESLTAAEANITAALDLLDRSGGAIWEFGLYSRAKARYRLGQYQKALDDLNVILEYNPSYGAAYYWRSFSYFALGDKQAAARDARKARALGAWPPSWDFTRESAIAETSTQSTM